MQKSNKKNFKLKQIKLYFLLGLILNLALIFTSLSIAATSSVCNSSFNSELKKLSYAFNRQENIQLMLNFTEPPADPKINKTINSLELTFTNTKVDYDLVKIYELANKNSLVDTIEIYPSGKDLKINIYTKQEFNYLVSTIPSRLDIEITANQSTSQQATATKENNKSHSFDYTGELISLSYHRVPLKELLAELAAFLNLNLIISDAVTGELTLELNNIPSDQALDLILMSKNLATRQKGQVMFVAPADELAKLDARYLNNKLASQETLPLDEAFIKVFYAKAKDLAGFINNKVKEEKPEPQTSSSLSLDLIMPKTNKKTGADIIPQGFLSKRGHLIVDERTNSIYVRDIPDNLAKIKRLIKHLDTPVDQVMIEARIVVARNGVSDDLGVAWGISNARQGVASSSAARNTSSGVFEHRDTLTSNRSSSLNYNPQAGFNFGFVSNNLLLDLELAALETENRSEVISQPKVITSDRNKAVIRSGQEIPYSSTNRDGERTTDFRQAELRLEVTPHLVGNGQIFLQLQVNNDSKGEDTPDAGPTINTNAVDTQILVNNGETLVIGGIFTSEKLEAKYKTPFLGDLPLIGWLFNRSFSSQEKVELLVFVTPKLVTTPKLIN